MKALDCDVCLLCDVDRQLAGSQWLEKKFIEHMLTEQLSDEDVCRCCFSFILHNFV